MPQAVRLVMKDNFANISRVRHIFTGLIQTYKNKMQNIAYRKGRGRVSVVGEGKAATRTEEEIGENEQSG